MSKKKTEALTHYDRIIAFAEKQEELKWREFIVNAKAVRKYIEVNG